MARTTTIGAFRRSLPRRLSAAKKRTLFVGWNDITQRSPVDTGRFRAAWNLAVDAADLSVPAAADKVAARVPALGDIPPGATGILSNNLPYADALNRGHSTQAPNGFVDQTVAVMQAQIDAIARTIKAEFEAR